jgi:hypothetical protein
MSPPARLRSAFCLGTPYRAKKMRFPAHVGAALGGNLQLSEAWRIKRQADSRRISGKRCEWTIQIFSG